jgi:hypothetical protein
VQQYVWTSHVSASSKVIVWWWHRIGKERFSREASTARNWRAHAIFFPARLPQWDDLLMDEDDPEKRIAELERQLAERKRGADKPPALPRTWVFVDRGEAGFGGQRPRRTVGWTGRVDVETIVVIGIVAPVLVTMLIPSSALWTSGIVCNTPSHLAYSESLSLGHATSRTFQCVSGDSSYAASKLAIYALQTLVSALVLCGTVAAGRLTWRLSRKRSLTHTSTGTGSEIAARCPAWLHRFAPTAVSESPSRRATGYRSAPRIF